jgi:hypothetical protein
MIKPVLFLAAISALAGSASAASLSVSVTGKAPAAIHAEIYKAANKVCRQELGTDPLAYDLMASCVATAVKDAEATPVAKAAMNPLPERLASAK